MAIVEALLVEGPLEGWKAARSENIGGDLILHFWSPGADPDRDAVAFYVRFSPLELAQWLAEGYGHSLLTERVQARILKGHQVWGVQKYYTEKQGAV
jgi:hypothetical protein